jgi:FtsH-binding integral membrane protein
MNFSNDFELGLGSDSFNQKLNQISLELRLGFIRKVYGILAAQLALTVLFCLFSMNSEAFVKFQIQNSWLFILCLILAIALPIVIVCFETTMRTVPNNYIILGVFTLAESYLVSFICALSQPNLVLMAAIMTLAMVIALTLYAFNTKTDFTMQGGALFIFGCAFMMLCLFGIFTQNKMFHVILCVIGIIFYGLYLVYDTQLIIGNKANMIEMDDYILGAFILYTDIVYLFLRILELLQLMNSSSE